MRIFFHARPLFQIFLAHLYFQVLDESYCITISQFISVGIDSDKTFLLLLQLQQDSTMSTLWANQ